MRKYNLKPSCTTLFILLAMLLPFSTWISPVNAAHMKQQCIAAAATWTWDDWAHVNARYGLATQAANTCGEARYLAQEIAKSLARTSHGATMANTDAASGKLAVCAAFYRIVAFIPEVRAENGEDLTKLMEHMKRWGSDNDILCAALTQQTSFSKQNQRVSGIINFN